MKRELSFVERRQIFFPIGEEWRPSRQSVWFELHQDGWLGELQEYLDEHPDDSGGLARSLDEVFSNLQCLPQSTRPLGINARGVIWSTDAGMAVKVVANGSYYRMTNISTLRTKTQTIKPRVKASRQDIKSRLYAYKHRISVEAARREVKFSRKGIRKPLAKRRQRKAPAKRRLPKKQVTQFYLKSTRFEDVFPYGNDTEDCESDHDDSEEEDSDGEEEEDDSGDDDNEDEEDDSMYSL